MPHRRPLHHLLALIAISIACPAAIGGAAATPAATATATPAPTGSRTAAQETGPVRVLSPGWRDVVVGETRFAFAVDETDPPIERIDVFVGGRLVGSALAPAWSFVWEATHDAGSRSVQAIVYAGGDAIDRFPIETRQVAASQEVDVSLVQLYPVVVDRRGRFVEGLHASDFEVLDQGRPVTIRNFARNTSRSNLALLLDVSQSMEDRIGVVRAACARFVERLGDRHALSVYAFNHRLERALERVRDPGRAEAALQQLKAGGGTALYDAVMLVLQEMQEDEGRRAMFVFSDGRDERSLASLDRAVQAARASGAIIYAVGTLTGPADAKPRDDLTRLAEESGGRAFFIRRVEELQAVLDDVMLDLEAQYVLSYPPPPGPEGTRAVEVRATDPRYSVRCRRQYVYVPGG